MGFGPGLSKTHIQQIQERLLKCFYKRSMVAGTGSLEDRQSPGSWGAYSLIRDKFHNTVTQVPWWREEQRAIYINLVRWIVASTILGSWSEILNSFLSSGGLPCIDGLFAPFLLSWFHCHRVSWGCQGNAKLHEPSSFKGRLETL